MDNQYVYRVTASSTSVRSGIVTAEEIAPSIGFSAPAEFHGQAGTWTPEHFLVTAVAACFVSTFSGMADLSKLDFLLLEVAAEGVLERDEGGWRFARINLRARLNIAQEKDREKAARLLEKAHAKCLIIRSLACPAVLEPEIAVQEEFVERRRNGKPVAIG
jgi:organic hydroperoxide reductase OsmC/OhrA